MFTVLLLGFVIIITPLQYLTALVVGPWSNFCSWSGESVLKERVARRSGAMDRR
jgi:hypothetical protein